MRAIQRQTIAVMLVVVLWGGRALAAEPAEELRFDPKGFRTYDLADHDAADEIRDHTPAGLTPIVPGLTPGHSVLFLLPKKHSADGVAQIVVESWPDDGIATATSALQARNDALATACPGASSEVVGEREESGFRAALAITHCNRDLATGIGRVLMTKLILGGDRVHAVEIAYHYPAFEPTTTPLLRSQMDEAVALLSPVKVCYGRKDEDCRIRPRHLAEAKPRPMGAEQAAAIAKIEALGNLLYRHDQLAWHGTDALKDRDFDLAGLQTAGWVTRIAPGEPDRLVYAGRSEGAPVGVVQVTFDGDPPSVTNLNREPLSGDWLAAFKAVDATRNERMLACTNARNMVSFPDPDGRGWLVYWMSASDQLGLLVSGGHTRFLVNAEGSAILGRQSMTKSCLNMPLDAASAGRTLDNVVLTHFVTDLPTEVHVFNSLVHKLKIVVFAPSGTWRATEGKLERIY